MDKINWPLNVIEIKNFKANIYSIREQIESIKLIPKETDILWWPHWNIPILYKGKIVTSIYDAFHLRMPWNINNFLKNIYTNILFYAIAKKSLMTLTISEFTKNELIKLTQIKNIHIVYPSVDKEWFEPIASTIKTDYPYVVYVGNVKPHKDLGTLIKAYIQNSDQVNHKLIIIGKKEGFDQKVIDWTMAANSKDRYMHSIDEVDKILCFSDMFILPSEHESFGLVALEAMACGVPVISSNAGGLPEVMLF